jgi:flagellar hook assembly protein FlgD
VPVQPCILHHNFPNPFNPVTTISYNLAAAGDVQLQVYNTRGQLVKTLVAEHQDAGEHSVTWFGGDDAGNRTGSGIYFYRIQTGTFTDTKKMILLK